MLCGLMKFKFVNDLIFLDEVELVSLIVKWFVIGVMSFGFISCEVYIMFVMVMNCIGGKFNIGEGGEEVDWFILMLNGDFMCLVIK